MKLDYWSALKNKDTFNQHILCVGGMWCVLDLLEDHDCFADEQ